MAKRYPTVAATMLDFGIFLELAVKLASDFGRMNYWTPNSSSFPKDLLKLPGLGVEGITRINDYHNVMAETDLLIVPDVFMSGVQIDAEDRDIPAWGSKGGDELELNRSKTKRYLEKKGIPVTPWEPITGTPDLRKYLADHPRVWVKADDGTCRGDFESKFSLNFHVFEPIIDALEFRLGPRKTTFQFIVEEEIKSKEEPGFDGITVFGQWPDKCMCGPEIKSASYAGVVVPYDKIPEGLRKQNEAISPLLQKHRYANFISSESKKVGNDYLLLEFTTRMASPAGGAYLNNITNLAEVIYEGASGKLVQPEYDKKYAFELVIGSKKEEDAFQFLKFPEKYRGNIKLRNFYKQDGYYISIPLYARMSNVGAIVAVSNDREEAKAEIREVAKLIEGPGLSIEVNDLEKADKELSKLLASMRNG